jgi:hypothetical protein
MRSTTRIVAVCSALALFSPLGLTHLHAGAGDAKATSGPLDAAVQQAQHVMDPMVLVPSGPGEPYREPSKWYGLWEPTEIFGHDARCSPTPFAPRGYGFPKKVSAFRMDYTPYRVRDCGFGSSHGPSIWWRRHRDPCCGCDPIFGGCHKCKVEVDNQ